MTHEAQLLWQPAAARIRRTQMFAFMERCAGKYGFDPTWAGMHEWSVREGGAFWHAMLEWAEIRPTKPGDAVVTGEGMLGTRWFPGMELNFAAHLLRFDDDRVALQAEDELGRTRAMTYRELRRAVARLASAMRGSGLGAGDRVGGFMPNIPETVIAMLAAASVGGIWSSCSPDFGINGVFDRFGQIEPKLLFAADGYSYNGKTVNLQDRVRGIVERLPSIETVVIVPYMEQGGDPGAPGSRIPNVVAWADFQGESEDPDVSGFDCLPFGHPLYIMYSSGTTGVPKCIVHGAGGTLLQHMKELMLHCDLTRDDTIFYFTTCGWMMWNWLISSLGVGATVVLYDGSPFYPSGDHLWQMAERFGISVFGTSPKFISACEKAGLHPGSQHDLTALRAVLSTGSPLTVENFRWVYENVKSDLQLSSISGGTDIISCFMLGNPILPVYAGELQCVGLGMDVRAFDASGKSVVGEKGELVCCSPFPSQPTGFWNDPDGAKYRRAYFEHYPGVWRHGDFVEITERGSVIVYGRSDATLNPGGVRIGTAEIYRQVESFDEVVDSVVVGKRTADADVEICLFVVLREGLELDRALIDKIKSQVAGGATRRHVPRHIKQVSAVPYTISGKKVELAVTNMIHGEPVKNRDALANPEALDQYAGIV
ncbi:MAG: acetoacetate--CoA ligase [Phycisphaerae bacterium]|jgi:acetoacetyl-CoA synthetase